MIARFAPFAFVFVALPALADANAAPGATATAAPSTSAAPTTGTATAVVAQPDKPKEDPLPLHASASLTNSLGTGTFIVTGRNNPTLQSLLSLSGSAKINDAWSVNASTRFAFEWTDSDGDTYNHQIDLYDPRFGVGYKVLDIKDIGLNVAASGGYSLPVSMPSRAVGSTGIFSVGGKVGWNPTMLSGLSTYGALGLGYSYNDAGLRAAYASAAPGKGFVATNGLATDTISCATGARGAGDVENGACSNPGRAWRWNAGLGASYSFLDDQVSVGLDMSFLQSFGAYQPSTSGIDNLGYSNADLASKNAAGAYDLKAGAATIGSLGVSYTPVKWFTLSGGIYTFQPLITGNTVRWFPLWDLQSIPGIGTDAYSNFSSMFIDTTFSI